MTKKKHITILDCTLRDGSYVIDNQFTADDTYLLTTGLDRAGFTLIEVGHGTGLGSYRRSKYEQAATDQAYIRAAKTALKNSNSKFGMFFIPGIGTMEDLEMAAGSGLDFIRIGTDVTDIDKAKPFIERAKHLGMLTCSNLMKSYAVSPKEFAILAKKADEFGADIISIVDSAGGMFPEEVHEYVVSLRNVSDKKIGFHGHNNLNLAIANSLAAVEAGAEVIDCTIQGMGRSAGNAQTEIIVLALEKKGYITGIDIFRTMDLGEKIVKTMMNRPQGVDDISVVAGIAQFHSSFMKIVEETAKKYEIDIRQLIIKVSERNRIKVTPELADEIAEELSFKKIIRTEVTSPYDTSKASQEMTTRHKMDEIGNEIFNLSKKTGKNSVLSLTISENNKTSFSYVRQSPFLVIGNVEAANSEEISLCIELLDGRVDWLCLDSSCRLLREGNFFEKIVKSKSVWYSENRALSLSVQAFITEKCFKEKVLVLCDNDTLYSLQTSLLREGIEVVALEESSPEEIHHKLSQFRYIVSCGIEFSKMLLEEHADSLQQNTTLILIKPNSFSSDFMKNALKKNVPIVRVDVRAGLNAELGLAIETKKMTYITGESSIDGIRVVAGGVIGQRGTIVVDSIIEPKKIIGVADGRGGLLSTMEEAQFVQAKESLRALLMPHV